MQKLIKAALFTVFAALLCTMNVQAKPGDEANAIVEKCKAIWSEGKLDMMAEIYSADVVRHSPGFGEDLTGLEALKEWITSVRTIYPDFAVEAGEVLAMGDHIVWHWTVTGTNSGPLSENVPATGKKVEVSGVNIVKLADGKIVEEWGYWNHASTLSQLGFTFTPPMAAEMSEKQ